MKLIMESWRRFLKEVDFTDPTIAAIASSQDTQDAVKRSQAAKKVMLGDISEEFRDLVVDLGKTTANFIAIMLDPSGQFSGYNFDSGEVRTASDDFSDAMKSFKQKPSLLGAGSIALASLSVIPLLGGVSKISKISKLSNSRKIVKSKAVTIRKAEAVADQLENAAKKTKNEKKRKKLAFAAAMIKRKAQETRAAMQNVDDYARTSADLKGSTLKTLSQRSANPARSAKARFLGPLYRGSHGEKLSDLKRQINIPETLNFDFLAAATKKASQKRGEWVKFRAPDGAGVRSSNRATGTGGASFSKSLETSEDFASGAYTRGTGTPKFEMMVVTSGKKADNIDFVAHYEKTGSPAGGLPSNIRKEKEVVMLGDNIPVDQIWIKVN